MAGFDLDDIAVGGTVIVTSGRQIQNVTNVVRGSTTDLMRIAGGSTNVLGGRIILYGESHATLANTVEVNLGSGGHFVANLPTSSPGGSNRLWNDNGTVKIT